MHSHNNARIKSVTVTLNIVSKDMIFGKQAISLGCANVGVSNEERRWEGTDEGGGIVCTTLYLVCSEIKVEHTPMRFFH